MYLYVKAVHVFAVVLLISGMLAMAFALRILEIMPGDMAARRFGEYLLRWDGLVTTPALAVVWMAGLTMAFGAGWTGSSWLLLKLVPAAFLTGMHLFQGSALKRFLQSRRSIALYRRAPIAILLAFAVVDWLAIAKPF